ncbi:sn-glycerol-3-phosphate dehydrogenase subunit C [bacterium BMS3Bbin09]|nr:sn-glycerol-3-phosphate dehydrogenase subunit C [bacterium BMS3Bbin09]HDH34958.1 heterodisulfide reductase [Nitrospirota bacterium]HDN95294.1 heterodisulfide reductase [Nitrospirota bacterium]
MAEAIVVKPDLDFVKGVIAAGGSSLKKCYQCATCTVVCKVTPDKNPFPRKEMVWAQWGLKEKFQGNPDIWLCHQCSDCTAYCPRGANPAEVLGAIRKQTIKQYSAPAALVDIVNNKAMMPLVLLAPAVLLAVLLSIAGTFGIPDGEVIFSKFASTLFLQIVFTPALIFGAVVGVLGVKNFWGDMKTANNVSSGDLKGSIIKTAKEVAGHEKFKTCDVSADRYTSHLLVFYGFVAAAIATAIGVLYIDVLHMDSPFSLGYGTPVKIFGNIGAIGIIVGIGMMMSNRFKKAEQLGGVGSYFDWLLIAIIGIVGLSGFLAQLLRIAGVAPIAYPMYFIHLVFVFSLFIYLPFSKLAHMFYRGAAMCFNKYSGREAVADADNSIVVTGPEDASEEDTKPDPEEPTVPADEVGSGEEKQ